jgi:hypothetical protein
MSRQKELVEEISSLRYELLGTSDSMIHSAQHACRRYLGILMRMGDGGDGQALRLKHDVAEICECLDRTARCRSERNMADMLQKSLTDLRMVIDMHLHRLGKDGAL